MFTPIGHILPETVKKNGMAPKVDRARAIASFAEAARRLCSEEACAGAKSLHCLDGTLTIACRSTKVASELRRHEPALLGALKNAGVKKLRLLLAPWR